MNEVTLRTKIATLVVAALLSVWGTAATSAMFANNAHADDNAANTGNAQNVIDLVQQSSAASGN